MANVVQLMSGDRVEHYWDGEQRVGRLVQPLLEGLTVPAWDVWMLYAPGVVWETSAAPVPTWWEHQMSSLMSRHADRLLDAQRFAAKAMEMALELSP